MKLFIAALLTAALIFLVPVTQSTPINNSEPKPAQTIKAEKPAQAEKTDVLVTAVEKPAAQPVEVQSETATVATPAPVSHPVGCENYRQLISQYDWNVDVMLAIAKAESGCRADATGDKSLTYQLHGRTYGYSKSIFQVRILPGREHCDSNDVQVNVRCAYAIYQGQGYGAWSVYNTGKYMQYL